MPRQVSLAECLGMGAGRSCWLGAPEVMHDDQVCFSPFIPAQECQRVQDSTAAHVRTLAVWRPKEDLSVQQMRSSLSMFQANPPRWVAAWSRTAMQLKVSDQVSRKMLVLSEWSPMVTHIA
eukprot:4716493-Amphidinium_carterae.1